MENIRKVIVEIIEEIIEQKGFECPEISKEQSITKDLGFTSMDVAQLIASLEMELDLDPFSEGTSIASIHTVGQLCDVYISAEKKSGRR